MWDIFQGVGFELFGSDRREFLQNEEWIVGLHPTIRAPKSEAAPLEGEATDARVAEPFITLGELAELSSRGILFEHFFKYFI